MLKELPKCSHIVNPINIFNVFVKLVSFAIAKVVYLLARVSIFRNTLYGILDLCFQHLAQIVTTSIDLVQLPIHQGFSFKFEFRLLNTALTRKFYILSEIIFEAHLNAPQL